ncbi:MAG: hydrolase [Bacteroidetes bacterium]|nr:MAG: hydrolase [Bacteroidota bacterium]
MSFFSLRTSLLGWLFLGLIAQAWPQSATPNRAGYRIHIRKTDEMLRIDGVLDEGPWQTAERATDFTRVLPIDTGFASSPSEVMLTYNDRFLYLGIIFHDTVPGARPVESLRRDFTFGRNDNFLLFMDTYNDQTNGFSFGLSAAGAQWDGLQSNGGSVNLDWDCKWRSAVVNHDDRWVMEMAIPFKSIRYQEGVTEWGINFSRLDLKRNEKSAWAPVPRQFPTASLAYTGTLVWDQPPPRNRTFVSFIPYGTARVSQDYEHKEAAQTGFAAGIDAKMGLTPTLNLDLTVNPDFSQVEVDRQVTNLDRFELFFPERRRFFLENNDLFANYGTFSIRPFFSRRIGLDAPVRAGARLSGNLDRNWRLGLLNMQTGATDALSAANFTVASLQRKVFARSNAGMFLVNKNLTGLPTDSLDRPDRYNRVVGVDYNLASADNRWNGKFFYHQGFRPDTRAKNSQAWGASLEYATQQTSVAFAHSHVGSDYRADAGFVRRTGIYEFAGEAGYRFFPGGKIANHGPRVEASYLFDEAGQLSDREAQIVYAIEWLNRSSAFAELERGYVRLLAPFDPTNAGGDTLPTGSVYTWWEGATGFESDARKLFNYELGARYGGFFHGERLALDMAANYRWQPYGSLALVATYNRLMFPSGTTHLLLIGPRLDVTFTDALFLTTFVQYNNQIDNLNVNVRLQWRYAPVSDLFIVYTDNYAPELGLTRNRALVAKLSYWLN